MTAEYGHEPSRSYMDRDGAFHLNGAAFYNDAEADISGQFEFLDDLSTTELGYLDGVTAGASTAGGAVVLDSNSEFNDVGVLQVTDTLITSAQLLALNATPKTIVAAPGAGAYTQLVCAYLFLDHGGTDYDGIASGEDLAIKYTNSSGAIISTIETTGFLDASADALMIATPDDVVAVANAALVLHLLTAEIASGDGDLKVRAVYRTVRTAELTAIS